MCASRALTLSFTFISTTYLPRSLLDVFGSLHIPHVLTLFLATFCVCITFPATYFMIQAPKTESQWHQQPQQTCPRQHLLYIACRCRQELLSRETQRDMPWTKSSPRNGVDGLVPSTTWLGLQDLKAKPCFFVRKISDSGGSTSATEHMQLGLLLACVAMEVTISLAVTFFKIVVNAVSNKHFPNRASADTCGSFAALPIFNGNHLSILQCGSKNSCSLRLYISMRVHPDRLALPKSFRL